ncbi:MAG TPA: PP2C family protein-serine/threonine phosphatase [Mycobacteriales bacterium]|nr:PP2C family protein-serine/threonine phosphatase [Mycobacteriales bacterium]
MQRRKRLGWLSAATLSVLLIVTGVVTLTVRNTVHNQENRLLKERSNEVGLVFTQAIESLSHQLDTVAGVLRATHDDPAAFNRASAALVAGSKGRDSIALLRRSATGYQVELAKGHGFRIGQTISGSLAGTLSRSARAGQLVPTEVMGSGEDRHLGFAIGPPKAPTGSVLYLQIALGALGPPEQAGTSPFNELRVVLYDAPRPVPSQALVTTTADLPLRGNVYLLPIAAGTGTWSLQVSAEHPLVGSTTAYAEWFALAGGVLLAVLVATIVEIEARRRRSALALYRSEHQIAESLQRSLLPSLPEVADLDVAARYLPGAADQEVGGDWYDVFELDNGHIGLAVGDVVGHDIDAAVLMSRVQTALRAHALVGEAPGAVLDRLDHLVRSLETDRLVTVFYGVLGPAAEDGSRELVFANAGHPPPLLHAAAGDVIELDDASSLLLGVLTDGEARAEHSMRVATGSTLLLYTDGLIETPGQSMTELVGDLKLATGAAARDSSADQLCDRLLDTMRPAARRDDVAMLAVRIAPRAPSRQGNGRPGRAEARSH